MINDQHFNFSCDFPAIGVTVAAELIQKALSREW